MKNDEIVRHIEFLLSIAISKCQQMQEAEDLVQETILAALTYTAKGNTIVNTEAWLRTVLNRKFYDMLRRRYKIPATSILDGSEYDAAADEDFVSSIIRQEEAENVRREVSFLSESYRTIIVKHYFLGESVRDISREYHISEGTVKSRLNFGRQQLMKGMSDMEQYTRNSYMPQKLVVRNSGSCGIHDEPMTLADDDNPLAQNLLILAYDKPATITELSKAIGVSSAYVEPVIRKLVDGELMKRMPDGKVYTDFILYQAEDYVKYIKEQEAFAEEYGACYCQAIRTAVEELKKTDFYSRRLERFMMIRIAENGLYLGPKDGHSPQIFPERPNGGRWIAFGTIYPQPYVLPQDYRGKEEYSLSGQRRAIIDRYLDGEDLRLYNYETSLYPYPKHEELGYTSFQEAEYDMLKLFYLIARQINPASVDCNPKILKSIPLLEERGFISAKNGAPALLIPHLTHSQERKFSMICGNASEKFREGIKKPLSAYLKMHKKEIPSHLKSVPDQKRTMPYEPKPMMFVYGAIKEGLHPRDLGYACPETYVVFD